MNLKRPYLALSIPLILFGLGAGSASAATISVTTTADPVSPTCPSASDCSFRGAVAAASPGDTVSLPSGTFTLTRGEVFTTKALTIQGAGREASVLDASGTAPSDSARVLRIGGAASKTTTIQDLSVTGGRVLNGSRSGGGGLRCNSRFGIVLDNVRVFGNSVESTTSPADHEWIGGGGLWSIGTAILRNGTIVEGNSVTVAASIGESGGGGVMIGGDYPGPNLILTESVIRNNNAELDAVDRSSFPSDDRISRDGGGGAYVAANDLTLQSSTVSGNTVTVTNSWGDSGGGGLYVSGGNLESEDSAISDNFATVEGTSDGGFSPNDVSSDGGGGAYVSGLSARFTDSAVDANRVVATNSWGEAGGGGVYVSSRPTRDDYVGDLNATRSTFTGNTVTTTPTPSGSRLRSHYGGGAIYQDSHDISLFEVSLAGNSIVVNGESLPNEQYSVNGGGAIYQYGNRTSIVNSTLSGNSARLPLSTRSGGGALMDNGNSSFITNSTFSGNSVSFDEAATEPDSNGGGAINYTQERDGVVLANVTISGNSSEGAAGGGIVPTGGTDVRIGNSIIAGNSSSVAGASECALTSGGSPEATVTSLGYNLSDDPDDSCGLDGPGDLTAAPGIGPLASNGGPTQTRALSEGSAAIDAGNPTGCPSAYGLLLTMDQRGFSRPSPAGSRCDIGAFELQSYALEVTKSGSGSGAVKSTPAGIDCGTVCSGSFYEAATVTLAAIPDSESRFSGWSGEGCSGVETCQVTMDQARLVNAAFAALPKLGKLKVKGPRTVRRKEKAIFKLTVRNVGRGPAKSVRVKVRGRGANAHRWIGQVSPEASRTVRLPVRLGKRGRSRVTFTVLTNNAGKKSVKRTVRVRKSS